MIMIISDPFIPTLIIKSFFKLPPRRLYTWKSHADNIYGLVKNKDDYISIIERFRNTLISAETYSGDDVPPDHNLSVGRLRLRLKKLKNTLFLSFHSVCILANWKIPTLTFINKLF